MEISEKEQEIVVIKREYGIEDSDAEQSSEFSNTLPIDEEE